MCINEIKNDKQMLDNVMPVKFYNAISDLLRTGMHFPKLPAEDSLGRKTVLKFNLLRTVPANTKVFCPVFDYAGKTDLSRDY